jgi:hypothetical protein
MREVNVRQEDEVDKNAEKTLRRLIAEQGVTTIEDLDQLAALWPADDDPDALMNYVLSERQARVQLDAEDRPAK